jgi:DnaK suppressor protein
LADASRFLIGSTDLLRQTEAQFDGAGTSPIITLPLNAPRCSSYWPVSTRPRADDHEAERETGDYPAPSLAEQGVDDATAAGLRDRLAKLDRALRRVEDGTYGRSIRSGLPIPDERLEADPAAELTVQEAANDVS